MLCEVTTWNSHGIIHTDKVVYKTHFEKDISYVTTVTKFRDSQIVWLPESFSSCINQGSDDKQNKYSLLKGDSSFTIIKDYI